MLPPGNPADRLMQTGQEPERTVPNDDAVQVTHVDAALAKISCARLGYFEDRFMEQLIRNRLELKPG